MSMESHPTVFISYSHDNDEHINWVTKLASDLRSHGVNVILDAWDLRIGSDLRFFMENGLSDSKLVICICSEEYVRKVDSGSGGSGYEGMIMTNTLLKNANLDYIIPVIRDNMSDKKVPLALSSKYYIDFTNNDEYIINYEKLLERIYDEDIKTKPELGDNPFSDSLAKAIDFKTKIESVKYHSPWMDGDVTFRYDNNNGIYTLGDGEYTFNTRWSRSGNNSIHAYGSLGFKLGESEFPSKDVIKEYDFSSTCRTIRTGQIVIFRNQSNHFVAIKIGDVKSSGHGNPYDEMTFQYHIYK